MDTQWSEDVVEALHYRRPREFVLAVERELVYLLEAPRGALLRLPCLSQNYRTLLENVCRRWGAEVRNFRDIRGVPALDVVATFQARAPVPLQAFVPGTWAGDSPKRWKEVCEEVVESQAMKQYLEMVMQPGHFPFHEYVPIDEEDSTSLALAEADTSLCADPAARDHLVELTWPPERGFPPGGGIDSASFARQAVAILPRSATRAVVVCADVEAAYALSRNAKLIGWEASSLAFGGPDDADGRLQDDAADGDQAAAAIGDEFADELGVARRGRSSLNADAPVWVPAAESFQPESTGEPWTTGFEEMDTAASHYYSDEEPRQPTELLLTRPPPQDEEDSEDDPVETAHSAVLSNSRRQVFLETEGQGFEGHDTWHDDDPTAGVEEADVKDFCAFWKMDFWQVWDILQEVSLQEQPKILRRFRYKPGNAKPISYFRGFVEKRFFESALREDKEPIMWRGAYAAGKQQEEQFDENASDGSERWAADNDKWPDAQEAWQRNGRTNGGIDQREKAGGKGDWGRGRSGGDEGYNDGHASEWSGHRNGRSEDYDSEHWHHDSRGARDWQSQRHGERGWKGGAQDSYDWEGDEGSEDGGEIYTVYAGQSVGSLGMELSVLEPKAVIVRYIHSGRWAEKMDVMAGDEISRVNGQDTQEMTQDAFLRLLRERPLSIKIRRSAAEEFFVRAQGDVDMLGMDCSTTSSDLGMEISDVFRRQWAAFNNLKAGDIIIELNGEKTSKMTTSYFAGMMRVRPLQFKIRRPGLEEISVMAGQADRELGMDLSLYSADVVIVKSTMKRDWAASVDISPGDQILKLNDVSVKHMTMSKFRVAMEQRPLSLVLQRPALPEDDRGREPSSSSGGRWPSASSNDWSDRHGGSKKSSSDWKQQSWNGGGTRGWQ
eukprot:TRINITY_DN112405_c0_g1_i1.p1 TRINITY_DN112405_c0_g1~~TRINITY_DN112405_c0_g1_i1.p1  ORF type:complete len:892 (-),score=166.76 TRINITY_DN112405_c0_g1_i1:91-2766(-)